MLIQLLIKLKNSFFLNVHIYKQFWETIFLYYSCFETLLNKKVAVRIDISLEKEHIYNFFYKTCLNTGNKNVYENFTGTNMFVRNLLNCNHNNVKIFFSLHNYLKLYQCPQNMYKLYQCFVRSDKPHIQLFQTNFLKST